MRYAESLIQGLVNPAFSEGLFTAGQAMGAYSQGNDPESVRVREEQRLLQQKQAEQALIQQQTQTKQEAFAKYLEAQQQTELAQLARNGVVTPENYKQLAPQVNKLSEKFVPVGQNIFDREKGQFITPPTKEQVDSLSLKDAARMQEKFTPESVNAFIKDPTKPLVPRDSGKGGEEETEQGGLKLAGDLARLDNFMTTLDQAEEVAGSTWPLTYDIAKRFPMTSARDLKGLVETIDSNLGFDRLQRMRDESKTGGALGQVSNFELELLRANVAAMDPAAGNEAFIRNLNKVKESYTRFRQSLLGQVPQSRDYAEENGRVYYFNNATGQWQDLGAK